MKEQYLAAVLLMLTIFPILATNIDEKAFEHRSKLARTPPDTLTNTPLMLRSHSDPSSSPSVAKEHPESLLKPALKSLTRKTIREPSTIPAETFDKSSLLSEFEFDCESPLERDGKLEQVQSLDASKLTQNVLLSDSLVHNETASKSYYPVISSRISLSTTPTGVSPAMAYVDESPAWAFDHGKPRRFAVETADETSMDTDFLRRLSVISPLSAKEDDNENEGNVFEESFTTGSKRGRGSTEQVGNGREWKRRRDGKESLVNKLRSAIEGTPDQKECDVGNHWESARTEQDVWLGDEIGDTSLCSFQNIVNASDDFTAGILGKLRTFNYAFGACFSRFYLPVFCSVSLPSIVNRTD